MIIFKGYTKKLQLDNKPGKYRKIGKNIGKKLDLSYTITWFDQLVTHTTWL